MPFLRAVETNPRMCAQAFALVSERFVPEILICVLAGRRSRSAWLLVKGTVMSWAKRRTWSSRSRRRDSRLRVWTAYGPGRANAATGRPRWPDARTAARDQRSVVGSLGRRGHGPAARRW